MGAAGQCSLDTASLPAHASFAERQSLLFWLNHAIPNFRPLAEHLVQRNRDHELWRNPNVRLFGAPAFNASKQLRTEGDDFWWRKSGHRNDRDHRSFSPDSRL